MALTYTQHDLYGGAITVSLPTDLVDASDLREIPDHQEVFLREHTLSSIIFEINEYQTSNHISTTGSSPVVDQPQAITDSLAATHHLTDTVQSPDYIVEESLSTGSVSLTKPSVAAFPSYLTSASIITPEIDFRAASHQATLPVSWQSNPVQKEFETKTQQLLIRIQRQGVDFCVRINAPMREFMEGETGASNDYAQTTKLDPTGEREMQWAATAMDTILKTLDVKDYGLFGDGDT